MAGHGWSRQFTAFCIAWVSLGAHTRLNIQVTTMAGTFKCRPVRLSVHTSKLHKRLLRENRSRAEESLVRLSTIDEVMRLTYMGHADETRDQILKEALLYRVELVAYARSLLGNYAAAEDAVQEAMLVVVKKLDQFEEGTSLLAWCRAIVRLEVLRTKQQRQRERNLAERLLDDAVDAAFEQFQAAFKNDAEETWREALEGCLSRVPERGRRVLYARFVEDMGYIQISERLDMTLEAVRKALFRLKKQVRSCVETSLKGTP